VAVLAPEPVRPKMAGMGIRALELARAMAGELSPRLLVPNPEEEAREVAPDLEVVSAPLSRLAEAASGADAAVVSGHAANWWFHQVPELPVAVDLYDPFPIENLHYARHLGPDTPRHDRETLALALARGDHFLCASAEQRLFWAGALFASGRVTEENFPDDPRLAGLLSIVPFGCPERAAAGRRGAGRAAAGIAEEGPLLLFGGVYDWYDPGLLLDAWPEIARRVPGVRLLFFESPNPETTPQTALARARQRARALDPEGRAIQFSPWLSYAAREDLYAACDLIVSIAEEGLETDLAYRTRLLDAAWGGLPAVSVGGGALARELEEAGAARRAGRSASGIADAVVAALTDATFRREAPSAARRFAAARTWKATAEPLLAWARDARVDPERKPLPGAPGGWLSRLRRRGA
jgi:hypothetical protein